MARSAPERLVVDNLVFDVRRSARRKTLEITVDRSGELIIAAPLGVGDDALAAFVKDKKFWLFTKMAEKDARQQPVAGKEFVSGEGLPYLGRNYRLLLVDKQDVPLKLEGGRFKLLRDLAPQGRERFIRWCYEHAAPWLQQRVEGWVPRMSVEPKRIEVRDLGYRWGSCGQSRGVNFHWATILLPVNVIDYIVVHELAHLAELHHTPEFWRRVARALPEYEQRKAWLAEHGGRHVLL